MWPAQKKLHALQYRGHEKVFETKEYKIFLDEIGSDHYQYSERNPHRKVRKHDGKWQFETSNGWKEYILSIQEILNSKQNSLRKTKIDDPPISANTGGTSNTIPDWWSALHKKIRESDTYCYILSRSAGPSIIDAYSSNVRYRNRNSTLDTNLIDFEESKYTGNEYNYFKSPSGNMLLVPPLKIGATDIKDFANRYEIDEWNILYGEIMKRWEPKMWVDTEGSGVEYLHIRFEKTPLYKPSVSHTRL